MRAVRIAIALIVTLSAPLASAQTGPAGGWLIDVIGQPVSPTNPSTTVRLSAYFPSNMWAFASGSFDLTSTDITGEFSNPHMPPPLQWPCAHLFNTGTFVNGGAYGVSFGQINVVGCIANSANPLAIWEATWTTQDFTPREVYLETRNTPGFYVFPTPAVTLETIELVARNQFRHGTAVIQVIPAPSAAALLLAATGAGMLRRRQRMSPRT